MLSWSVLDVGVDRDAIWHQVIASKFNDQSQIIYLGLFGKVGGVDSSPSSLCVRTGSKLLNMFNKSKSYVTKFYEN